ncbi:MAG: FG-GAP-like repeat-containing protein, partial [Planctomycetota bacterium]
INQDNLSDVMIASTAGRLEIFFSSFSAIDGPNAFNRATVTLSDTPDEIFVHIINADWNNDGKPDLALAASTPVGVSSPTDIFTVLTQ